MLKELFLGTAGFTVTIFKIPQISKHSSAMLQGRKSLVFLKLISPAKLFVLAMRARGRIDYFKLVLRRAIFLATCVAMTF